MFTNLLMATGNVYGIASSKEISPLVKVFCSLSVADGTDILSFSKDQLTLAIDETDRLKIKILIAAIFLVNKGDRVACIKLLNSLGQISKDRCVGWNADYFFSLWNMLLAFLGENSGTELQERDLADIAVIGDSHTVGLSIQCRRAWRSGHYLPGFRLSLLASPQENLKTVALKNSFSLNYDKEKILLSVGEIDFRSAASSFKQDINGFEKLCRLMNPAFEKIRKYAGRHQKILINAPYPLIIRNIEKQSNTLVEQKTKAYTEACEHLNKVCSAMDIQVITLPEKIFVKPKAHMIDHAHYTPSVYREIFCSALDSKL